MNYIEPIGDVEWMRNKLLVWDIIADSNKIRYYPLDIKYSDLALSYICKNSSLAYRPMLF